MITKSEVINLITNKIPNSEVIVEDLIDISKNNKFYMHNKENYDFDISRSFLQ